MGQGRETRPTFFLYRHQRRPYHIDYCFLPTRYLGRIRDVTVDVGPMEGVHVPR